jgi:hypothetical protein
VRIAGFSELAIATWLLSLSMLARSLFLPVLAREDATT